MVDRTGTSENDNLLGTAAADLLIGLAGDDILEGLAGADELRGGAGSDELRGGGGGDELRGGGGEDLLFGSGGGDTLRGGRGGDELEGGRGDDLLLGGRGDDILSGDNGRDDLRGGPGVDFLEGGNGDDRLDGGDGNDVVAYVGSPAGVVVDLGAGQAVDAGGSVDELIGIEGVLGSSNDDVILGGAGSEVMLAGAGDDLIGGRLGIDILFGGEGDDRFIYGDLEEGGDIIADFETIATADGGGPGDTIVLDDAVLEGFEPGVSDVSAFFELVDNDGDAQLRVDANGGADDFATLATLSGLEGATTLVVSEVQLADVTGIGIQIVTPDAGA